MSDETTEVPKTLLRRVKEEVEGLRERVEALERLVDARTAERDALEREVETLRGELLATDVEARVAAAVAEGDARAARLRAERDGLAAAGRDAVADAEAARAALHEAIDQRDHLLLTHPAPPARAAQRPASEAPDDAFGAVGYAFAAWCRRGTPLVSRPFLFAAFLAETTSDAVEVVPVFRDPAADDGLYRLRPATGAESWLVSLGDVLALVPYPVSPDRFAELAPAYSGEATPRRTVAVTPARIEVTLGAARVTETGHIDGAAP